MDTQEKITPSTIAYGLKTIFMPSLTRTLDVSGVTEKFEDLNIDELRRTIRGMLIDVDGTLTCGNADFSPEVVEKLREIRAKMPACVYCNQKRNWPVLEQLGIPVARNLPQKPDPRGFDVAIQLYLQNLRGNQRKLEPEELAMVGDNRLTDGGCRQIGMKFIHVNRLPGPEKGFSRMVRLFGDGIAGFHRSLETIGHRISSLKKNPPAVVEIPHPLVKALYERPKRRKSL